MVEIAIVLAIVGLLLAGLLPTISGQVERQHINDTRKQLDDIQQALMGFAIANGRLPCPADGTIASGQANAGADGYNASTNTCNNAGGVLPWATLGVGETDAWGRRFTYRVDTDFADAISNTTTYGGCTPSPTPTQSSFALCSSGNLKVLSTSGGTNVATGIPAVVVSHGINGLGAYTTAGQQIAGASGDENENANNDDTFVSHDFVQNGFDDLVVWISPNILLNRMVTAGKLP